MSRVLLKGALALAWFQKIKTQGTFLLMENLSLCKHSFHPKRKQVVVILPRSRKQWLHIENYQYLDTEEQRGRVV